MPRTSPGVARSPGAVQRAPYAGAPPAGANWNGAPGNPSASRVVPRGGGSFSVGPGGVNRGPADGSRERPDFPGTRGGGAPMVMPRNGAPMTAPGYSPNVMRRPQPGAAMAPRGFDGAPRGFDGTPRGFDSAPRGFGGDRSRTYAPGGVGGARPGAPLSPQSVMPRGGVGGSWSGGAGMRGSESRTFGPQGGGSFRAPGQSFSGGGGGGSFAVPRGPQSMSPGFGGGGGGGVAPRSGGSMRAPAQPGPPAGGGGGGGGARSPGSRRPG